MNGKDLTQGSILGNIIPFIIAYNIIASIFRGLGDSKSPMYFVAVACVVNIVLDYLFIGFLGLGAMGAALGTTLSQISCLICVGAYWWMKKMNSTIKYNQWLILKKSTYRFFERRTDRGMGHIRKEFTSFSIWKRFGILAFFYNSRFGSFFYF